MRNAAVRPQLQRELSQILSESESYRIDHYLGKELVMNVLVLRFANICFEVNEAPPGGEAHADTSGSHFSHPPEKGDMESAAHRQRPDLLR